MGMDTDMDMDRDLNTGLGQGHNSMRIDSIVNFPELLTDNDQKRWLFETLKAITSQNVNFSKGESVHYKL